MQNFQLNVVGRTAIVTGAGAGVAKAIALQLALSGAQLVVNDQNPDRVDTTVDEILASGGKAVGVQGDISNRFQVSALIEQARDAYGKIDYLVNGVGIYRAEPFLGVDEWDLRRQVEVNIIGTFFCIQLLSRVMADEGGGVILNLSSTAGYTHTIEQGVGYATGKAGIVAMTQQAARELAPKGIRMNVLCIGNVDESDMPTVTNPSNALQRLGTPDEAANAALFLLSDAASFITGQALVVDGGGF